MNGTTFIRLDFGNQPRLRLKGEHALALGQAIQSIFAAPDGSTPEQRYLYSAFKDNAVMDLFTIAVPDMATFETAAKSYGIRYAKVLESENTVFIMTRANTGERIKFLTRLSKLTTEQPATSLSYTSDAVVDWVEAKKEPTLFTEDVINALEDPAIVETWTPQQYKEYIFLLASMPIYSVKNREMIADQRPSAELVAAKSFWRLMGREVSPEAKSLRILKPVDETAKSFEPHEVYDIKDTITVQAPVQEDVLVKNSPELYEAFKKANEASPVPIYEVPGIKEAQYIHETKTITAPIQQGDPEKLSELLREIAHAQLHKKYEHDYTREKFIFQGECIACALATRLNAPIYIYDFDLENKHAEPSKAREYVGIADSMIFPKRDFKKEKQQKKNPRDLAR